MSTVPAQQPQNQPQGRIVVADALKEWLVAQVGCVAFSTYLAGKVIFLGSREDGQLTRHDAGAPRCMGTCVSGDGRTIWIASQFQLWRLEKSPAAPAEPVDAEYSPRVGWTVGDVDAHDIAIDPEGEPIFVAARYSCLARPGRHGCFDAIWRPKFISKIASEDRCHLNGLAMRDGRPAFVSVVAEADIVGGWRDHRADGGVIIDVASDEVVASGLSMPHSPRWNDGKLYVLNSGFGAFGTIDLATGKFEEICLCPGYARGLAFVGRTALIGVSDCRENRTFAGLPLDQRLKAAGRIPRCGIIMVNLDTGEATDALAIDGTMREIYDVVFVPGTRQPKVVGLNERIWFEDKTGR